MILIDYKDTRPIYEQVIDRFRLLILRGAFEKDEKIPSVRTLAMELSINPNTIQRAYSELERQGYIYTVKGRGNFVCDATGLREEYQREILKKLEEICREGINSGMTKEKLIDHISKCEALKLEWDNICDIKAGAREEGGLEQ
ncbi:MAG: GntR family transcriptional regulator [Lachnospiraceae bacterium]|nr:GntR family transcriptional regulator [Lachnospiraceae bacterium]